jgi:hypothetical protein
MKNQKLQNGKKLNKTVKKKSITGGKEMYRSFYKECLNMVLTMRIKNANSLIYKKLKK